MSAPKVRKWKMPCCAMMAPISSVISRMIGTAFHATRSRCLTMEVKRKVCGRTSTCRKAATTAPPIWNSSSASAPTRAMVRPTLSKVAMTLFSRRGSGDILCVPACTFSNSPRWRSGRPTSRVSTPWLFQARSVRSISQAP